MEEAFDAKALTRNLARLPKLHRLVMGAMVCERLVPNYRYFEEATGRSGYDVLKSALDSVWTQIEEDSFHVESCNQMLMECDKLVPNSEDFSTNTVSMAIDAAASVCALLEAASDTNPEKIAEICTAAVDTVHMYLQSSEFDDRVVFGAEEDAGILVHPLMQLELRRQREDYMRLTEIEVISPAFIANVRNLCNERGGSLMGHP